MAVVCFSRRFSFGWWLLCGHRIRSRVSGVRATSRVALAVVWVFHEPPIHDRLPLRSVWQPFDNVQPRSLCAVSVCAVSIPIGCPLITIQVVEYVTIIAEIVLALTDREVVAR